MGRETVLATNCNDGMQVIGHHDMRIDLDIVVVDLKACKCASVIWPRRERYISPFTTSPKTQSRLRAQMVTKYQPRER